MTTPRNAARLAVMSRQPRTFDAPRMPDGHRFAVSTYYGRHVLDLIKLREKLPREAFQSLISTLKSGTTLTKEVAETVASAAREWAVAHGATHFTHWFQPMTGLTAEKHDAFIDLNVNMSGEARVLEKLSGSQLWQSEPDASSFPSGGMRSTFEARGYTAWDPSVPMFLVESVNGPTLCIPSVYISYHGHSLDHKTPLLRSVEALDKKAVAFLKLLGDVDVKAVSTTLGVEQEYFLVDRAHHALRTDLLLTEKTLLGAPSPRHQQFEDHYFGTIPPRVIAFMEELEFELYRLGIPVRTRHNEVAPMQFEMAPIFEDVNLGIDHNVLGMDIARKVALRHDFVCLFHEKPFSGINGSGKHCNWSMATDRGENLLEPGKTPHQNLRFLAFLAVCLKAVHDHSVALRWSVSGPNNDLRLGANEAPPAILSAFVGEQLTQIIERTIAGDAAKDPEHFVLEMGVGKLPTLAKDNTDRNRTSPFAFTGNKFEFRAVGSSANCAVPMAVLNAAAATALAEMSERLQKKLAAKPGHRDQCVAELLREVFTETSTVRFEGNGYSEEWKMEAAKRGLPNLADTPAAITAVSQKQHHRFLVESGVLSQLEVEARINVSLERYNKQVALEAETLVEILTTQVVPAAEKQMAVTGAAHRAVLEATGGKSTAYSSRVKVLAEGLDAVSSGADQLQRLLTEVHGTHDELKLCARLGADVRPLMAQVREAADRLEQWVDDDLWPLPKYREMLFVK
ncbi:MAG: glutamine synthetase III [Candidatus Eisenbacteria bacterium]